MKKRTLALLLAILTLSSSLAACGGASTDDKETTKAGSETTAPAAETTSAVLKDNLPDDLDFNGSTVGIFMQGGFDVELLDVVENDIVSTAVKKRNDQVEERLKVKLDPFDGGFTSGEAGAAQLLKQILAGDQSFQLVCFGQYFLMMYQHRGCFLNMTDAQYLDFDMPWWSTRQISALQVRDDLLYQLVGDVNYSNIGCLACIFMNKKVLTDVFGEGAPDTVYEAVLSGNWTLDMLQEYSRKCLKDMDGNTVYDMEDCYGLQTTMGSVDSMIMGVGVTLSSRDEDGTPYMDMSSEKNIELLDRLNFFFKDNDSIFIPEDGEETNLFVTDHAGFLLDTIRYAGTNLRNMESEYGILPVPKVNTDQENYISNVVHSTSAFAVSNLVSGETLEMCCAVLEAMNSATYRIVSPAYYEKALKTKYTNDNLSGKVIDIIHDTAATDFADIYGDKLNNPMDAVVGCVTLNKSIASTVANEEANNQKTLDKYLKKFDKLK